MASPQLHSELLKKTVLHDFYEFSPQKFLNVTNGVTPRRWLALSNPELSQLITSKIGEEWITHEDHLKKLAPFADDPAFRKQWRDSEANPQTGIGRLDQRAHGGRG